MTFEALLAQAREFTRRDNKTLTELALKLTEETGEVSEAVLSATGAAGSRRKEKNFYDVREEATDVILCALSVWFRADEHFAAKGLGTDQARLTMLSRELARKSRKWEEAIERESEV